MPNSLSNTQLHQLAAHGARARIQELEAEIAAIRRAFPQLADNGAPRRGRRAARKPAVGRARRGKLSAAGRARIVAAQKARWAKVRRDNGASAGGRRRRGMSAAARRAASLRMKKYWAAKRGGKARAGK